MANAVLKAEFGAVASRCRVRKPLWIALLISLPVPAATVKSYLRNREGVKKFEDSWEELIESVHRQLDATSVSRPGTGR